MEEEKRKISLPAKIILYVFLMLMVWVFFFAPRKNKEVKPDQMKTESVKNFDMNRNLSPDTQEYDQFTLPKIQLILNQAMKESGYGEYVQITVTVRNDIVDFDCEFGQLFLRGDAPLIEIATVKTANAIGKVTAIYTPLFLTITSWKSGRMWILSQGKRTAWVSTKDCRKALSLGHEYLLNAIKAVEKG